MLHFIKETNIAENIAETVKFKHEHTLILWKAIFVVVSYKNVKTIINKWENLETKKTKTTNISII